MKFTERIKNGWHAFWSREPTEDYYNYGPGYSYRPDRQRLNYGNDLSIVNSIFNRIAVDCAAIPIRHVKLDENNRYIKDIKSTLNDCLLVEANIDQTGRAFMHDLYMSLMDEGCVAVIPIETNIDPNNNLAFDIYQMRIGKVVNWYPKHVRVEVYNERTGLKEEITLSKKAVGIIENPFYSVMNGQNSVAKRLVQKLNLLDAIDKQSGSGKLDLIIQLPYVVKSDTQKTRAETRRMEVERQLTDNKYGIAYTDGSEKITQLNRPVENNLMKQVEYLTSMLHGQLGITQAILEGTADEKTTLNYINNTIEPILSSAADEFYRKFLSKTARTQGQAIKYYKEPFKLVPVTELAEIADKFTRNEIMTSNEIRQVIGMKPSKDPSADELRNKNLSAPKEEVVKAPIPETVNDKEDKIQNE